MVQFNPVQNILYVVGLRLNCRFSLVKIEVFDSSVNFLDSLVFASAFLFRLIVLFSQPIYSIEIIDFLYTFIENIFVNFIFNSFADFVTHRYSISEHCHQVFFCFSVTFLLLELDFDYFLDHILHIDVGDV